MVDDLRPALRAAGDNNAITPNIDKLIQRSSYFSNAFAQVIEMFCLDLCVTRTQTLTYRDANWIKKNTKFIYSNRYVLLVEIQF